MTESDSIKVINPNDFLQLISTQSDTKETCLSIVRAITNGEYTIFNFVESLENILANEDMNIRRGGVDILTTILSELPKDVLNSDQIIHFIDFYCSRLNGHHSFIPSTLKGLLALVKMHHLPDKVVSQIFTTLNLNFTCQSQPQADRRSCYELMQIAMEKKPAELQALGPDFVCGYLSFINSERDPRNLLLLFENLPYFFKNFPLGHLTEDAFEAVSCYFPIDFRTDPKDPRRITRDDLSNMLMPCLTANEEFYSFAIELALEKFSSDLEIAKIDSMMLLKKCFSDFSSDKTSPSSLLVVPVLVDEMKPGKTDAEIQRLCSDVTSHIIKTLYYHNESDTVAKLISLIYSNLEAFLNDIELSFFLPTVRLLAKISSSCSTACQFFASKVIPKIFFCSFQSKPQIIVVLECLHLLLAPCTVHKSNCADILGSTWEQAVKVLLDNCESSEKEILIAVFPIFTDLISLFNDEQKYAFFLQLFKRIKFEVDTDIWKIAAYCLRLLAKSYFEDVKKLIHSENLHPDYLISSDQELEKRKFQFWCVLAPVSGFATYLDSALKLHIQNSSNTLINFVIDSLKNLIVQEKSNKFFLNVVHNQIKLTDYLLNWWYTGNTALPDCNSIFDNEPVAINLTYVITIIVSNLDEKSQMSLSVDYFKLMIDSTQRFMNSFYYLHPQGDLDSSDLHCSLSIISFEAILNGIRPEVLTEALRNVLPQIVKYLITVAMYCSRPFCCIVACRCLATVMNKFLDDADLQPQIESFHPFVLSVFTKNKVSLTTNGINMLFHLAKSLIYRNHRDAQRCFDLICTVLSDQNVHKIIEEGFRFLSVEDEYFLNASSHFRVDPEFNERLFSCAVPKLLEFSKSDDRSLKRTCALSIVHLSTETTLQNIFLDYQNEIVPLFLTALDEYECLAVVAPTLDRICEMLKKSPKPFEERVESFLTRLLGLACAGQLMGIRIAALKCLLQFSKLNLAVILPFKARVCQELMPCLDDRKRLVRREAVKTRSHWLVLGTM